MVLSLQPDSVPTLCEGVGSACGSQLRSKGGTYGVIVEGSSGVGRRWVVERIWVMEATESSHRVGGCGGGSQLAVVWAGVQVSFPVQNNSAYAG